MVHTEMNRYFLRNDFVFPLKYTTRKYNKATSEIEVALKYNSVSDLGKYLYELNKLTNITKVHVIGYGVDIAKLIPILDFYANIIYDYCNKKLILHIDTDQATSLKKTAIENPELRKYDAIQFQSDPDGLRIINGADRYHFRRDCDNVAEYFH
mgnify:FL=1|jgi:hypothetical protein